jgi:hypothetical protein
MIHEIHIWWIMFWAMPEWIQATVLFSIGALIMWFTTKINVAK